MTLNRLKALAYFAFATLCLAGTPVLAAGTTPFALVPQIDHGGNVAAGCKLYFYVAGTVATPQDSFVDFGLTTKNPWPLTCDQGGRVPMHWIADGLVHLTLIDDSGITLADTTMQALGPSSGGGGGGGTVDPTTLIQTGDIKVRYGTGAVSGFVRANGLTIGNVTSGASERANNDTQALFVYLCTNDANLVMVGGRSGNCLTDFNASKQLTLPDWRGRALAALDDMGNSAAGRLTASYFGTAATVLGAAGGSQSHTQTIAEMPSHNHGITDPGHSHSFTAVQNSAGGLVSGGTGSPLNPASSTTASAFTGITINNTGGGNPFSVVSPMLLATVYIRL